MDELTSKRRRLVGWMADRGFEAVFLARVANFAWFTGGLEPVVMLSSDRAEAGLLITPDDAFVVCNTIEHPRLRDEDELERLGFRFHTTPWYEGVPRFEDLVHGKQWAADWPLAGAVDASADIARLRFSLLPEELDRYRWLGRATAEAVEEVARRVRPGKTEYEIAGDMASVALSQGVTPTLLLVGADDRVRKFRHPIPTPRPVEKYAMLVICGRRWGLVASTTRLVHWGPLDEDLSRRQDACARIDAAFIAATKVGARVSDIFARATETYAASGYPDEWKRHNQGGAAGYESRDYEGTPTCPEIVLPEQAFAWNPSIAGVKSEDTFVVHPDGVEFLTSTGNWPTLRVTADGCTFDRPAIMIAGGG